MPSDMTHRAAWEFVGDKYPFTQAEFEAAVAEWGCNCGPSSLAFVVGSLDTARHAIPGFESKGYTSPSMMKAATVALGMTLSILNHEPPPGLSKQEMFVGGGPCLVRVQWCGPWTRPGVPAMARYRKTHWVVAYTHRGSRMIFDCNGGIQPFDHWERETVPMILEHCCPKADGRWYPTHRWRVLDVSATEKSP